MSNKLRLFSKPLNNLVRSNFGFKTLIQQKSNLIISNNVRFFSATLQNQNSKNLLKKIIFK